MLIFWLAESVKFTLILNQFVGRILNSIDSEDKFIPIELTVK